MLSQNHIRYGKDQFRGQLTHVDVYKTWAQMFKAEPMRQAKAGSSRRGRAAMVSCQNAIQATHTWFWYVLQQTWCKGGLC